jgi:hypothetical protein
MRSICTVLVLSGAVTAQSNLFEIYSGCTNNTSRGTLGGAIGDILMKVPQAPFRGVAHDASGGGTVFTGFRFVTQDEDASTQELFDLIVRRDTGAGLPDCTPASALIVTRQLQSPLGPPGRAAWLITVPFATPSTAIPLCGEYYMGMGVAAAPAWVADGQSLHMGSYFLLGGTQADNPSPNAPNLAWNCALAGLVPSQPPTERCYRFGLLVPAPVLNIGNVDPTVAATNCISTQGNRSWGAGGLYPVSNAGPRQDGLDVRLLDAANPGGFYVVMLGLALPCPGFPFFTFARGALYLHPASLIMGPSGFLDGTGTAIATVVPPGVLPPVGGGAGLPMQAWTIGAGFVLPGSLSNGAASIFL